MTSQAEVIRKDRALVYITVDNRYEEKPTCRKSSVTYIEGEMVDRDTEAFLLLCMHARFLSLGININGSCSHPSMYSLFTWQRGSKLL